MAICAEESNFEQNPHFPRLNKETLGNVAVRSKSERVELEMQIMKYRQLARLMAANPTEMKRIQGLVAELEQKLREIDE